MKYRISSLLILLLLLCGCAKQEAQVPVFTPPTDTAAVPGLYGGASNLEISSSGALRVYPLGIRPGKAIVPFDDDILLLSSGDKTTLTMLRGDTLVPTEVKSLTFCLDARDCLITDSSLAYFDPLRNAMVELNGQLEELRTIPGPSGLKGAPLLFGNALYYFSQDSIRVWDLETGIHRVLRKAAGTISLHSLHCDGQVLRCLQPDGTSIFLSTETGALLGQEENPLMLSTQGDVYIAATWETNLWSLVFGQGDTIQALTPRDLSCQYYLPEQENAVITASQAGDVVTLEHYDLTNGRRTASQMVRGGLPLSLFCKDGMVFSLLFLGEYEGLSILSWDLSNSTLSDPQCYTGPHFTARNPDRQGLAACQAYARQLGEPYGIDILVWEAGTAAAPQGISLKPEHRVNILSQELSLLDHRLAQFPVAMLKTTAEHFSSLKICLVAEIIGETQSGSLQFFEGENAYILLEAGNTSQQGLYHQLYHIMETHILSHSSALDRWDELNPQGFQYDYDYQRNAIRNSGIYLTVENRAFVDTFSMSYPKEDRARILEFALLPEQSSTFQAKAMQKKLRAVCSGLREAYDLNPEETYPWEQYLK